MKGSKFVIPSLVLSLLLVVALLVGCATTSTTTPTTTATPTTEQKVYKLSYQALYATGNPHFDLDLKWANQISQRTQGRIEITVHPLGELGYKGAELLRTVQSGILGGANFSASFAYGDEPRPSVMSTMGISAGMEEDKRAADAIYPEVDKILREKWNQVLIADYITPDFLNANRPVITLEDWRGLKVRTWDPTHIRALESIGAGPVIIPTSDIYMSLATGVIDANIAACITIQRDKAWEVAKYANMWAVLLVPAFVTVNKSWLESMPQDLQNIFMDESAKLRTDLWQLHYYGDRDMLPSLQEKGLIVTYPAAGEQAKFIAAVAPLGSEDYLKGAGADGQRLIDMVRAAQQKK